MVMLNVITKAMTQSDLVKDGMTHCHVLKDHHGVLLLQAGSIELDNVGIKAELPQQLYFLQAKSNHCRGNQLNHLLCMQISGVQLCVEMLAACYSDKRSVIPSSLAVFAITRLARVHIVGAC